MAGATVHPVDDRIFVRRQESNDTTEGGIAVPEAAEPSAFRGVIVAVGPGMPTMTGGRMRLTVAGDDNTTVPVQRGDGVIYSPEAAQEISIESGKFDVLHFRDIICVLKQDR